MAHTPASDDDFFNALLGEDSLGADVGTHMHMGATRFDFRQSSSQYGGTEVFGRAYKC